MDRDEDMTLGIWSPGVLAPEMVELELQPFAADDERVARHEAELRASLEGGNP